MSMRGVLLAGVAACSLAAGSSLRAEGAADAASADAASGGTGSAVSVQEVVVTARKRSERLADVPMSITAATGEQLQKQGVTQVSDLQKIVPGFTYQPSNFGTPVFSIRGIGDFDTSVAVAPTVSVYVDQAPLPYSVMTEGVALDLQRVEVLKGPQGTLFGQNSTGGAINYIANKPTRQFDAGVELGYGNFNAFNAQGFVSGPLTDTLSARLAVSTEQRGDWQTSETRDAGLGRRDFTTGRLLLDWKPRDNLRFELNLNGWIDKSDTQAAQFVAYAPTNPGGYQDLAAALSAYKPAPNNDRVADWDANTSFRRNDNFYQGSLRGDWDIASDLTLTSITTYSGLKQHSPIDVDGTYLPSFSLDIHDLIHSVSQELRLSGNADQGRLKWMLGGNYEKDTSTDNQFGDETATNSGVGPLRYHDFLVSNNQAVETKAVFGSLDYSLTHTLMIQGSARYTQSDDDFHGCLRDPGDGAFAAAFSLLSSTPIGPGQCVTLQPPPILSPLPIVEKSLDQDNVSWRVGLDWKPQAGTLLYANVTKGYKAGGFPTVPALFVTQFNPIGQESVLAYEVGFKQALLGRSLQISGAGFYYDYTDKQILGYVATAFGNLPGLVSIPKSSVTGGELALTWTPVRGLTVNAGGTYVDSRVSDDFLTNDPFSNVVDIKGEQFPNSPKWQLTGDVEYDFPVSEALRGYVGVSPRYRSASVAAFGDSPAFRLPGYALLDLRAGIASDDGHWYAEVWGRNVTDQFYATSVTHVIDTVDRLTGMPATFGVRIGYRFR